MIKKGLSSQCWPGLTHPARGDGGERYMRKAIDPPTREEFVLADVIIGLGVGLKIGEEGA